MNTNKYAEEFTKMGIDIKPISPYYTPDSFGRELMRNARQGFPISYSNETILTEENKEKVIHDK